MGKHQYTKFDRARDELMSHVVRCDVFDAEMDHRQEWLAETMEYMAERYPMLSDLQLTQLEIVGRQFIKPPIPHGKGNTARSRDNRLEELVEEELTNGEADAPPEDVQPEDAQDAQPEDAQPEDPDTEDAELQAA